MTIPTVEYHREGYTISTDKSRLNVDVIHHFLSTESYWAKGVPIEIVRKGIENSLCYGVYHGDEQVGFGRIVTDYATFAYLADIFILSTERGKGLGKWLVGSMVQHPELQKLRMWTLMTTEAHGLYAQFGFQQLSHPEKQMEMRFPNRYS